jgi:hypothetical protein
MQDEKFPRVVRWDEAVGTAHMPSRQARLSSVHFFGLQGLAADVEPVERVLLGFLRGQTMNV